MQLKLFLLRWKWQVWFCAVSFTRQMGSRWGAYRNSSSVWGLQNRVHRMLDCVSTCVCVRDGEFQFVGFVGYVCVQTVEKCTRAISWCSQAVRTNLQILPFVCFVMSHALTQINSAVWFSSNLAEEQRQIDSHLTVSSACFAWQGLGCAFGCVTFRRVDFCSVWSICLYSHQSGRFWITAANTKDLVQPTWFIGTDLLSPAERKENISSVSSKTFHRPRSSYIALWYFSPCCADVLHECVHRYYNSSAVQTEPCIFFIVLKCSPPLALALAQMNIVFYSKT